MSENLPANQPDLSVLTWAEAAVGPELLAYTLGCAQVELGSLIAGETTLTSGQESVVQELTVLRAQIAQTPNNLSVGADEIVRHVLTNVVGEDAPGARKLRIQALGPEEVAVIGDEMEQAIFAVALDALPAFLLPPNPELPFMPMRDMFNTRATSAIFSHPKSKVFREAVLRDANLKKIFATTNEHTGHVTGMIYRNTGRGDSIQLLMLPEIILRRAWQKVKDVDIKPQVFAEAAVEAYQLIRKALEGKGGTAVAKQAYAGVLLPPGSQLDLGDAIVRAITDKDRQLAPASLKGQLTGTDQAGNSAIINYDGDILLEYPFPYEIKITKAQIDGTPQWPSEISTPANLQQKSVLLRFSLMLAVERKDRAQLVPTWLSFDGPLEHTSSMSWNDPRQGTGIMPLQLTNEEVAAWRQWYDRLNTPAVAKIELALTRILRAVAERREPSDVLIDSVIAWENLFGTKEGEPTFRVTACLAKLLAPSSKDRLPTRSKLAKIYALRSDVVHGTATIKQGQIPLCYEAMETAIGAIKRLIADRMDILALPDGAQRSAALLLGD